MSAPASDVGTIPGPGVELSGFTILELLVVLVIIGVTLGVVAVDWPGPAVAVTTDDADRDPVDVIRTAQRAALRTGDAFTALVRGPDGTVVMVTAFPDGRVVGAESFGLSELTGQPHGRETEGAAP